MQTSRNCQSLGKKLLCSRRGLVILSDLIDLESPVLIEIEVQVGWQESYHQKNALMVSLYSLRIKKIKIAQVLKLN
mgnify:CR=1 FL=1